MNTLRKYRRAFAAFRRGYREEREEARKRREKKEERKPSVGEILRDAGGEVSRWIAWTVWCAVCVGFLTVVLMAFGAPLWFGLGVGLVCYIITAEATLIREP